MKILLISVVSLILLFQDLPYKAKDEFEVKLKFEFRTKTTSSTKVQMDGSQPKTTGPLPYLKATVVIKKIAEGEARARVEDVTGKLVVSKKIEEKTELNFDLGYTDDLKGRTSSHEFTVKLQDANKQALSRIVITFDEDGSYYINGEKRGKV